MTENLLFAQYERSFSDQQVHRITMAASLTLDKRTDDFLLKWSELKSHNC